MQSVACTGEMPEFLRAFCGVRQMRRLKQVGMNCGCEYTSFPRFVGLEPYSRYDHSLGTGMITWRFTRDRAAAVAALLHDLATPVFAHTVDFLNGDYETQSSTEAGTEKRITGDGEIMELLRRYGLRAEQVTDYHLYPVADNDTPKLSSDRLEYTLGNAVNFGMAARTEAETLYADLCVTENESGEPELTFMHSQQAIRFAELALRCSQVYSSREDRYAMQLLAELLDSALRSGVLTRKDLDLTEPEVIARLESHPETAGGWQRYRGLHRILPAESAPAAARIIPAKKRFIDPLVIGLGRVSETHAPFRTALTQYLQQDFSVPVAAE